MTRKLMTRVVKKSNDLSVWTKMVLHIKKNCIAHRCCFLKRENGSDKVQTTKICWNFLCGSAGWVFTIPLSSSGMSHFLSLRVFMMFYVRVHSPELLLLVSYVCRVKSYFFCKIQTSDISLRTSLFSLLACCFARVISYCALILSCHTFYFSFFLVHKDDVVSECTKLLYCFAAICIAASRLC